MTKDRPDNREAAEAVKLAVKLTYDKLIETENLISEANKRRAVLKRDLSNLKEGRLDRIESAQALDAFSKETSVFTIEKKVTIGGDDNPWYIPYLIRFKNGVTFGDIVVNNSVTKTNASGAYKLENGETKFL